MPKTALLLFVRSEGIESRKKKLVDDSYKKNSAVIKVLNKRLINTANSTDLPVFIIDSKHQVGVNFSQRFGNAFQYVFDQGYDEVISLGNDVPALSKEIIEELQFGLQQNDISFGCTQKSGVYAFGLTRKAFSTLNFDQLAWQSSSLVDSITNYCKTLSLSSYVASEVLFELNDAADIHLMLRENAGAPSTFARLLEVLTSNAKTFHNTTLNYVSITVGQSVFFRGPPALIA